MNKAYFALGAAILFSMVIFPLSSTADNSYMLSPAAEEANASLKAETVKKTEKAEPSDKSVAVWLTNSKKTVKIDILEYLVGVTAAEIGATAHPEALKAQAVAAHTLLLYRRAENAGKGYDITDSSDHDQSYFDRNTRKQRWGDHFDSYESTVAEAVGSVLNKTITYNGRPILAVYFDTSSGKTESAANVWGGDYPYLQPVESAADMLSPQYLSTVTYAQSEFASMASSLKLKLSGDASKWLGESVCSQSGTVLKATIGGKSFKGSEIRAAFNLRSANFDAEYKDGKFIFTVRGWGHGVGMSQYGADYMAKKGAKYDEILRWYYTNVKISG
ncbi:MAG: stage II sporulation protein D [Acutalibacteraceae bacterium]